MPTGGSIPISREVQDILIADAALTIAFSLLLSGGINGLSTALFVYVLPISLVAVSLSFILHELMHKFVAQRFGAVAGFRKSDNGILITLLTSLFGFLIGLPGATIIYAHYFTKEQEGIVSLAGPLTNFCVFIFFSLIGNLLYPSFSSSLQNHLSASSTTYLQIMLSVTVYISIYLAFFNMLPIYPLDGSKVLRWNVPVYFGVMAVIFGMLFSITGLALIPSLLLVLVFALLMSSLYRNVILF